MSHPITGYTTMSVRCVVCKRKTQKFAVTWEGFMCKSCEAASQEADIKHPSPSKDSQEEVEGLETAHNAKESQI